MRFDWTRGGDFLWVSLSVHGAASVADDLLATLKREQGWKRVYFDFQATDRIGAYQLHVLARCASHANHHDKTVHARCVSPTLAEIFEISRLSDLFIEIDIGESPATKAVAQPSVNNALQTRRS